MKNSYILKRINLERRAGNSDYDYNGSGLEFCGSEFEQYFPFIKGQDTVTLTVSTVPLQVLGELTVTIRPDKLWVKINNNNDYVQILRASQMTVKRDFDIVDEKKDVTVYVSVA